MKRIFAATLALILSLAVLVPAAGASSRELTLALLADGSADASVSPGDVVTVTLTVADNSGAASFTLAAMQDYICYDPDYLEPVANSAAVYQVDGSALLTTSMVPFSSYHAVRVDSMRSASIPSGTTLFSIQMKTLRAGSTSVYHKSPQLNRTQTANDLYTVDAQNAVIRIGAGPVLSAAPTVTARVVLDGAGSAAPGDTLTGHVYLRAQSEAVSISSLSFTMAADSGLTLLAPARGSGLRGVYASNAGVSPVRFGYNTDSGSGDTIPSDREIEAATFRLTVSGGLAAGTTPVERSVTFLGGEYTAIGTDTPKAIDSASQTVSIRSRAVTPPSDPGGSSSDSGSTDSDSGGTGDSGGSSSVTTLTVPVSGDQNTVSVSASVSGTTAAVQALTETQLNNVIGAGVQTGTVVIDVSGARRDITAVSIPADTVRKIETAIVDAGNDAQELEIKLTDGSVTFDAKALEAIVDQMKGADLRLNLDNVGTSALNSTQRAAVTEQNVQAVYDAYMTSNGTRISDFRGGSARVTVSYKLKAGQQVSGVHVWFVSDSGAVEEVPTTVGTDEILFTISHFSHYVVTYAAPAATVSYSGRYNDCAKDAACPIDKYIDAVPTAWYHDGVHWALENGVMNGVSPRQFQPDGTASRAMVATMLWRLEGSPVVSDETEFVDVPESEWYADAVRWAASAGIITGSKIPAKTAPWPMGFRPGEAVTREQLAAMLYRYAQYKGLDVSAGANTSLLSYRDASGISEYAASALRWACGAGVIGGMTNGTREIVLAPHNASSRAVVATMFMRYCTTVLN